MTMLREARFMWVGRGLIMAEELYVKRRCRI
jgi:hypothetical protein